MSKGLRQHVKEHYAAESLPAATLQRLCSLVDGGGAQPRSAVGSTRRLRLVAGICAAAALMAMLAIPLSYFLGRSVGRSIAEPAHVFPQEDERTPEPTHLRPKLVAVRLHADWCNRSPQIAPVFERVEHEYGMKPILLVTLDVTDELTRHQSEQLADAIGISWLLDRKLQTGTIAVVNRDVGEVLAVLTDPVDWPVLASAVGKNLPD